MTIMLNIAKLAAVSLAATDATRHYLQGVQIEVDAKGVTYVATDGNILIAAHDDPASTVPTAEPFIIPIEFARQKYPKGQVYAELGIQPEGWFLLDNRFRFQAVDGTFPEWRRVLPGSCSGKVAQFDPDLMTIIKKATKIMNGGKGVRAPYVQHNGDSAALVTWNDDTAFAVIMPVRSEGSAAATVPNWAKVRTVVAA